MEQMVTISALKDYARDSKSPIVRWLCGGLRFIFGMAQRRIRLRSLAHSRALTEQDIERVVVFSIQYIRDLEPGDIAEFGVFSGRYAMLEARELASYDSTRAIHLFDSWSGHGPFDEKDLQAPEVKSGQLSSGPLMGQIEPDALLRSLKRIYRGPIHIHKGFFSDTVKTIPLEAKFVMVVMDGNLFSSTNTVLNHLFSNHHIAQGAVLLFPGWNLGRASPDQLARKAWSLAVEKYKIQFSDEGRYYGKGAKFIVQSYE
jgi:hypothetical protein